MLLHGSCPHTVDEHPGECASGRVHKPHLDRLSDLLLVSLVLLRDGLGGLKAERCCACNGHASTLSWRVCTGTRLRDPHPPAAQGQTEPVWMQT